MSATPTSYCLAKMSAETAQSCQVPSFYQLHKLEGNPKQFPLPGTAPASSQNTGFKVSQLMAVTGYILMPVHANQSMSLRCTESATALQVDMTLPDLPIHHGMFTRCDSCLGRQKRAKPQENIKMSGQMVYF